jgi:hypothetical protein
MGCVVALPLLGKLAPLVVGHDVGGGGGRRRVRWLSCEDRS